MKKIFYITTLLLLIGCKNNSGKELASFRTITDIFDQLEIADLNIILNFFNDQICSIENKANIIECYQSFFERVELTNETGNFDLRISFQKQQEMYNQISEHTFNQIWIFNEGRMLYLREEKSYIFETIEFNSYGKYLKFLKELGKKNKTIKGYYEDWITAGGMSPTVIGSVLSDYKHYDIRDLRIQLVIAIHYLTLNHGFETPRTVFYGDSITCWRGRTVHVDWQSVPNHKNI